jgi:hypothetical protein
MKTIFKGIEINTEKDLVVQTTWSQRTFYFCYWAKEKVVGWFYQSSGTACPEIKKKGEVFPFLGVNNFEDEISSFRPEFGKSNNPGWIRKNISGEGQARTQMRSYFYSKSLFLMARRMEKLISERKEFRTIPENQFFMNRFLKDTSEIADMLVGKQNKFNEYRTEKTSSFNN